MRVLNIGVCFMRIQKIDNSPSFLRKPNAKQMQIYTSSVQEGLNLLGKQVDLILHNSSAPAIAQENTGIGSLFSRTVAQKVIPFLKEHGISGIQQEPNNLRKPFDNSPYAPESSAKNILMIPLEKLSSEEYGNILSKETFNSIVKNNKKSTIVDYPYVKTQYENALKESYKNLESNKALKAEFETFKQEKGQTLEKSAIYRVLSEQYNNSDWQKWKGIDKNLYSPHNQKDALQAQNRISEVKSKFADEIDYFLFKQMLVEKEIASSNALSKKTGVKIIGDSPVASPASEEWANQDLYLKDAAIGCPPDYFSKNGQRWGFKYFNPDYIFNKDGSLGKAGKVLQAKYEDYFASCPGGMRIDHVIGLVDPFIYSTKGKKMTPDNSGRIYSIFSGKYQKHSIDEYAALIKKIVIPSAEKYGMTKNDIICEDLGDKNIPTEKVMKKLDLSGISVTQFDHRGATTPAKNTIMIGSHDNSSFLEFVDDLFNISGDKKKKNKLAKKAKLLAEDTIKKGATNSEKKKYIEELKSNKSKFIEASFAELFTSPAKRVQIFFTDMFGIGETYNRPGTTKGCWSLRLSENFENDYYNAVADGKAPNFANAIATAIRQRGLDKGNEELLKNLDESAKILSNK